MASLIDRVKMIPVSENDVISPGCFYFGCLNLQRKTNAASYWIVFRTPQEWLPDSFLVNRPVQTRVYPFWVVGKDQKVWLPRSSLFYLDRSQRDIFPQRMTKLEFTNSLILIDSFQNTESALTHFQRRIVESTRQDNERREQERREKGTSSHRQTAPLSTTMDETGTPSIVSANTSTSRDHNAEIDVAHENKSQRIIRNDRNQQRPESAPAITTVSTSTAIRKAASESPTIMPPQARRVKSEQEERQIALATAIPRDARVRIYIGRANEQYVADVAVLQRSSPILYGLVNANDAEGRFIMHPRLRDINSDDFLAVLEFMQTGEYNPAITNNPDGNDNGPMALKGCYTVEHYSKALIQAGRLFLLAKMFQVKGLIALIVRKVVRAQYKVYNNTSIIEFARTILTRPGCNVTEYLDKWAVEHLAENFMQIMRSEREHNGYLNLVNKTTNLNIHALVLEKAAMNYRRLGGLPVVIDDD